MCFDFPLFQILPEPTTNMQTTQITIDNEKEEFKMCLLIVI